MLTQTCRLKECKSRRNLKTVIDYEKEIDDVRMTADGSGGNAGTEPDWYMED